MMVWGERGGFGLLVGRRSHAVAGNGGTQSRP